MSQLSAQQYASVYQELGIDTNNLGCIMLNTEPLQVSDVLSPSELYYANNDDHKYVNGIVSETVPHVTVLYGLMQNGLQWKDAVDTILDGWLPASVQVAQVISFDSNYEDEQYYCLAAELELTDELVEGNSRLRMLPHIDTFPAYRAHITLAYIKQDEDVKNEALYALNERFAGKPIKVLGLNYGS